MLSSNDIKRKERNFMVLFYFIFNLFNLFLYSILFYYFVSSILLLRFPFLFHFLLSPGIAHIPLSLFIASSTAFLPIDFVLDASLFLQKIFIFRKISPDNAIVGK
jgi:hypothetical protein